MDTYFIKKETMAVFFDGEKTTVIEREGYLRTKDSPLKIINRSLQYFGSDIEAAHANTKMLLGNIRRSPIMVSWENDLFFFPCHSIRQTDNTWLSLSHIKHIFCNEYNQAKVCFSNNVSIVVDAPYKAVHRGFLRALQLKKMYEQQFLQENNRWERKAFEFDPNQEILFVRAGSSDSYVCESQPIRFDC